MFFRNICRGLCSSRQYCASASNSRLQLLSELRGEASSITERLSDAVQAIKYSDASPEFLQEKKSHLEGVEDIVNQCDLLKEVMQGIITKDQKKFWKDQINNIILMFG